MRLKPETFKSMLKRFDRPLLVAGPLVIENSVLDLVINIIKRWNLPVVATANTYKFFAEKNVEAKAYGLVEIVNLLQDKQWKGLDGKGQYNLVIFIGCNYNVLLQCLSSLKHFAPHIKTITICKHYYPNAYASFPNMDNRRWLKYLKKILES
nr:CO dehydrogenase/acetyl-CoA synthase complex subunit epsilon [Methanothermus fervidus]